MSSILRRTAFRPQQHLAASNLVRQRSSLDPMSRFPISLVHNKADSDKKQSLFDKDAINTEPDEYSKTGTDSQVAKSSKAFEPSKTTEEQKKEINQESEEVRSGQTRKPLDVSPGKGKDRPEGSTG